MSGYETMIARLVEILRHSGIAEEDLTKREEELTRRFAQEALWIAQKLGSTPIGEAKYFSILLRENGYTQEEIGRLFGCSQPYVANRLRLLNLPTPVQDLISAGKLQAGHGLALLPLLDRPDLLEDLAQKAADETISCQQLHKEVKAVINQYGLSPKRQAPGPRPRRVTPPS